MINILKSLLDRRKLPKRYKQLLQAVEDVRPMHILEIGVWTGERSKEMISIASRYRKSSDIHYYGFDLFEIMDAEKFQKEISKQPPTISEVREKLEKTGASIHLYKGDTLKTLPEIWASLPKMDIVFIDGGHSIETIQNDWEFVSKLLHEGSVVIFDDYWSDRVDAGAKETVDSIDRKEYKVEILPITDFFENTDFGPLAIQFAKITKL